jgi:hypothetical protein
MPRPRRTRFGVQDDNQLLWGGADQRLEALKQLSKAGAKDLRINAIYSKFHQADGSYNWKPMDDLVNQARFVGLHPQLTLMGDPVYGDKASGLSATHADAGTLATYAHEAATHFKGRVGKYSVWNEPNHPDFLKARTPAKTYRKLYDAGLFGIRSADQKAQVDFGELAPMAVNQFIRRAVGRGGVQTSAIALHPYGQPDKTSRRRGSGDITHLAEVQRLVQRLHKQGKLNTASGGRPGLDITEYGIERKWGTDAKRAALMRLAMRRARKAGARQVIQYQFGGPKMAQWDTALPVASFGRALRR